MNTQKVTEWILKYAKSHGLYVWCVVVTALFLVHIASDNQLAVEPTANVSQVEQVQTIINKGDITALKSNDATQLQLIVDLSNTVSGQVIPTMPDTSNFATLNDLNALRNDIKITTSELDKSSTAFRQANLYSATVEGLRVELQAAIQLIGNTGNMTTQIENDLATHTANTSIHK